MASGPVNVNVNVSVRVSVSVSVSVRVSVRVSVNRLRTARQDDGVQVVAVAREGGVLRLRHL